MYLYYLSESFSRIFNFIIWHFPRGVRLCREGQNARNRDRDGESKWCTFENTGSGGSIPMIQNYDFTDIRQCWLNGNFDDLLEDF
jgi:hypothetical protein